MLVREAQRRRPPAPFARMAASAAIRAKSQLGGDVLVRDPWLPRRAGRASALPDRRAEPGRRRRIRRRPRGGSAALDNTLVLEPQLASYRYVGAAGADLPRRLAREEESRSSYEEVLLFSENQVHGRSSTDRTVEAGPATARRSVAYAGSRGSPPILARRSGAPSSSVPSFRLLCIALKPSTARWKKKPSSRLSRGSRAMLDFPELGEPLRKMIRPDALSA